MSKLTTQIIILAVIIVIIFGGIIGWALFPKEKPLPKEEVIKERVIIEEIFSLTGVVSEVNVENNFLMVRPMRKEKEVKVIVSEATRLIKLELPFDPENPPPPGTQFTPKQIEITLADFKEGEEISIKTTQNIAGKTEFGDVEFIQILP